MWSTTKQAAVRDLPENSHCRWAQADIFSLGPLPLGEACVSMGPQAGAGSVMVKREDKGGVEGKDQGCERNQAGAGSWCKRVPG